MKKLSLFLLAAVGCTVPLTPVHAMHAPRFPQKERPTNGKENGRNDTDAKRKAEHEARVEAMRQAELQRQLEDKKATKAKTQQAAQTEHEARVEAMRRAELQRQLEDKEATKAKTQQAAQTEHEARVEAMRRAELQRQLEDKEATKAKALKPLTDSLYAACQHGAPAAEIAELIKLGANPNAHDADGITPLDLAFAKGCTETGLALIKHGARINTTSLAIRDFLRRSVIDGDTETCILLLEAGAPVEYDCPSLLHLAAGAGHPDICSTLIKNGINANIIDNEDYTPLHYAAINGHTTTCMRLIENGARVDAQPKERVWFNFVSGQTPLHCAVENNHIDTCVALIRKGAPLHTRDDHEGHVPLAKAAKLGHTELCKVLLRNMLLEGIVDAEPINIRRNRLKTGLLVLNRLRNSRQILKDLIPTIMYRDPFLRRDLTVVLYSYYCEGPGMNILSAQARALVKKNLRVSQETLEIIKTAMREAQPSSLTDELSSLLDADTLERNFDAIFFEE